MTSKNTVILEEDPETGDLILPLGEEFCKEHDWQIGDKLDMKVEGQAIIITNKSWIKRQKKKSG